MSRLAHCVALHIFLLSIAFVPHAVHAQAPANDNWANRTVIGALPFNTSETHMYQATVESTDPDPPCRSFGANNESNTLWYGYTTGAAAQYLTFSIPNNQIVGMITVYTGTPGAFAIVAGGCGQYQSFLGQTRLVGIRLAPNTSYSIKVGATFPANSSNTLNFGVNAAVQYLVTKTDDTNDGTCDGDCSLREAISASNANPGAVIVPAGTYDLTIGGPDEDDNNSGDLDLISSMGLYGAGMTQTIIDAHHIDRVLQLDSHGTGLQSFAIEDLSLRNGNASAIATTPFEAYGGGLAQYATFGLGPDYIGIERVTVTSSFAGNAGGGLAIQAPATIRDSVISNNTSSQYGGGGVHFQLDPQRFLDIRGTTIFANAALGPANGGGIYALGNLRLTNSTISGNHANYYGGGIHSQRNGVLTMANSTVVFNSAASNPFMIRGGGGVLLDGGTSSGTSSIVNSIIAYNTVANASEQPDCAVGSDSVVFTSAYNLVQFPNNCNFAGTGDVTGVDAGVLPALADNGGATPTFALLGGSPALNSGDPAGCKDVDGVVLTTDQRGAGFPRTIGAACDKGALESPVSTPPGQPAMNAASDSGVSNSDGITSVTTPSFNGVCTSGTQIQLQVDGANVAPTVGCLGNVYAISVLSAIAEGTHTITATATGAGSTSLHSAPLTVAIDTTAPIVTFSATPANQDPDPNPSFSFAANEGVSAFACRLDSGSGFACSSPTAIGVSVGVHTFYVGATDIAGNVGLSASYTWVALPPSPGTPVLAPGSDSGLSNSDGVTNAATESFSGSCTDGDTIQLVELGTPLGTSATCSASGYALVVALAEGTHAVGATATRTGYMSPSSATATIVIDRTPPASPTITGPGTLSPPTVTINGFALETEGVITVTEGSTTLCTASGPFGVGIQWSCQATFNSNGVHALKATQTDLAGNVSAPSTPFNVPVDLVFRNGFE